MADSFFTEVYQLLSLVPAGRVVSYGQLAKLLGRPRAARQVGWALHACPENLPWHRVVMADGTIAGGEYAPRRRAMLEAEGVRFLPDGRVDMAACRWTPQPKN